MLSESGTLKPPPAAARETPPPEPGGPPGPAKEVHVPALDGIRGVAILLVVVYHARSAWLPAQTLLETGVRRAFDRGWVGVDLFFVLSGFLITGILLDTRGKRGYFRSFYPRRMLRTFPLYYATLLVCFVLLPLLPAARFDALRDLSERQGWFWLHLSNAYVVGYNFLSSDGPAAGWMTTFWSLAVEEHFYLAWPLVVCGLGRKSLARVCVGAFVASPLLRGALATSGFGFEVLYHSTFTRLDGLLLGSLVAVLSRGEKGLSPLVGPARGVLAASGVTLAGVLLPWGGSSAGHASAFGQTLLFSFVALFFAALLVLVHESAPRSLLRRFFSARVLRLFGRHSFAMYLLNLPIVAAVQIVFLPSAWPLFGSQLPAVAAFIALETALTLAAALVTWHVLEKHCLKLKRFFSAG